MRDEEYRQEQQCDDERINHQAHGLDDEPLATAHDGQQAHDQHKRQCGARRWRDVQLVLKKTAHGIGQGHAVDQQDREDCEEIQQGNHRAGTLAEMLFDHIGDVGTLTP